MKEDFFKGRDIILFGFQPWEIQTGSNLVDMAFELAQHNRVLYVNRALNRASVWNKKREPDIGDRHETIRQISKTLWVLNPATVLESINWIGIAWLHDQLNRLNNRRLAGQIRKAIIQLDFSKILLINDNDFIRGRYLNELLPCEACIFYLRDYLLGVSYFQRHGRRLEAATIALCTMVAANTAYLANYAKEWNSNSFDIGQGFYLNPALKEAVPDDLYSIPGPVIGYVGYISTLRIDEAILSGIATAFPQCSLVLVGQTDEYNLPEGIAEIPNIYFLGRKPVTEVHRYIRGFDICINPQKLNPVTNGNYPRKIDEYLALGKPVVATKTAAMALFKDHVSLCTTPAEFIAAIAEILRSPDTHGSISARQQRMEFAGSHTWGRSMARLYNAYLIVKRKQALMPQTGTGMSKTGKIIRAITICALMAYLIFIYIKFMFF